MDVGPKMHRGMLAFRSVMDDEDAAPKCTAECLHSATSWTTKSLRTQEGVTLRKGDREAWTCPSRSMETPGFPAMVSDGEQGNRPKTKQTKEPFQ